MVDLLEYQAKQLFTQVGIPTLPSQVIKEPRELRQLRIPYPIVVKSQVRASGRAKVGGVRFAENTIDAIAAATTIFNLEILGEFPEVVLAEAKYDTQFELFLAVVLDYQSQCPVLLGSQSGGVNLQPLFANLQIVPIEREFSEYHGRELTRKMGLEGIVLQRVSKIISKMYDLFISKDLDLIEINPLGISKDGEVMALDGKIKINDKALLRHQKLLTLTNYQPQSFIWLTEKSVNSDIGFICSDFDLGMATLDLFTQSQVNVSGLVLKQAQTSFPTHLATALRQLADIPEVKVIFLNILRNPQTNTAIFKTLINFLQPTYSTKKFTDERIERPTGLINRKKLVAKKSVMIKSVTVVLRLLAHTSDDLPQTLASLPVYWVDSLESGVKQTISIAQKCKEEDE